MTVLEAVDLVQRDHDGNAQREHTAGDEAVAGADAVARGQGAQDHVDVRTVTIPRMDGSGARDPANPHPEGKVPYLVDDGHGMSERGAIILYLTDMFPKAGLGPLAGDPQRGGYLSWLSWYHGVMEPVLVFAYAQLDHPILDVTFRGVPEMVADRR